MAPEPAADPDLFLNRELSALAFQHRVLAEAWDPNRPVLERTKFLAIAAANLDEFYMVRVAALRQQISAQVRDLSPDGLTPAEQLAGVRRAGRELLDALRGCYGQLKGELARAGIHILDYGDLDPRQVEAARETFDETIFPVLTPLAFDPGRPFPFISNLSLNLAVAVRAPDGESRFARIKVPGSLPRLLPLKRSSGGRRRDGTAPYRHYFVWLEQVIAAHVGELFPGLDILEAHPFRVIRDADIEIQELEASDLLETIAETVRRRRFGHVVLVTMNPSMPEAFRALFLQELQVDPNDTHTLEGPLGLSGLHALGAIERPDLREPRLVPAVPAVIKRLRRGRSIFDVISEEDILLHHPFDSFAPVIEFLESAANDPNVLAIKQTLYRVGGDSPVVDALLAARQRGKQVSVLVELKARFDEESNITWARTLENEGVHVVYGLLGLKTHSKVALVVRREPAGIRRYVHLATGNYNQVTAQLYTDIGLFTADPAMGADATDLFNYLTGYSMKRDYRKLLVAPLKLREGLERLIQREIGHGSDGHLIFKMNSLVDQGMIQLLYAASRAGVGVDLIVRGICCLRPGVPGVSENIRVRSIVGRFLEHSRVYYFKNGGAEEVWVGSADLMPRNIDRRVEVVFPIEAPHLVRRVVDEILGLYLADTENAWGLDADGAYAPVGATGAPVDSQAELIARSEGLSLGRPE